MVVHSEVEVVVNLPAIGEHTLVMVVVEQLELYGEMEEHFRQPIQKTYK
jgi:hypothetical protein